MSIRLRCPCGKELDLPEALQGKKVRCKDCGKIMMVPLPRTTVEEVARLREQKKGATDLFHIAGLISCPSCGKNYSEKTMVCVECGVNIQTGATLYASLEQGGPEGAEIAAPSLGLTWRILSIFGFGKG